MKRFTISILTYKALEHSKRCIESVIANSKMDEIALILTANGSKEALDYFNGVQEKYPDTIVVWNEENQGFIKPNKNALTLCKTEFFILLNDDVVLHDNRWLEKLSGEFDKYPNAALSGPYGTCQSIGNDFNGFAGAEFEYLEGSLLCCKTEIVKKHGLFSDYLRFAYGEDSDLSLRMRANGYTLHKVKIAFSHACGQTSKHIPQVIADNQVHNHIQLRTRWRHYLQTRRMDFPIVVRRMAAHGDVLLITPILKALKERWPLCPITVETQECMFPLFQGNPYIAGIRSSQARTFDTLYINLDMAYENRPGMHIIDAYCKVAGVEVKKETALYFPCDSIENNSDKWIAVHPGPTSWEGKNWPMGRWDAVCKALQADGYKIALVGHGNDIIACNRDMRGRTSIEELAREIARCQLFIGVDSFPIHIAQAVKVPVIGLFGVTDAGFILTDGSKSIEVCDKSNPEYGARHKSTGQVITKSDGAAMRAITVEMVLNAVKQIQ